MRKTNNQVIQVMARRSMVDGAVMVLFKRYNHPGRWYRPTSASTMRYTKLTTNGALEKYITIWGTTKYYPVVKETE